MKKSLSLWIITLFVSVLALSGCGNSGDQKKDLPKLPYDKIEVLQDDEGVDLIKPADREKLAKSLENAYSLPEEEAKGIVENGHMMWQSVKLGRDINYEEVKKPHVLSAEILLWYSDDYTAVIAVEKVNGKAINENYTFQEFDEAAFADVNTFEVHKRTDGIALTLGTKGKWIDNTTKEETDEFQMRGDVEIR